GAGRARRAALRRHRLPQRRNAPQKERRPKPPSDNAIRAAQPSAFAASTTRSTV
ncbi:MAG: hypothetical protein AVDCRST_MAG71-2392, partial [uncultured Lysobacter sp.]